MAFRRTFFYIVAFLALLWLCGGTMLVSSAASSTYAQGSRYEEGLDRAAYTTGLAIGATTMYAIVYCPGVPIFLIAMLLAWRNGVGLRNERRHRETLEVMRGLKSEQ